MLAIFPSFAPRRGMIIIILSGILFLPCGAPTVFEIGPIKFSKENSVCYTALLCFLLYDSGRLNSLSLSTLDFPALLWLFCPGISALLNEPPPDGSLPIRDAASQTLAQFVNYAIPYFIGRVYFFDLDGMRELAYGVAVAALAYIPLCLYEVRMSPQLHAIVYGYPPHRFDQQIRFDGYRPMVFIGHGLLVALFMCIAFVLSVWVRKDEPSMYRLPGWSAWALGAMVLLCKSVGSLLLAAAGVTLFLLSRTAVFRLALLGLAAVPPAYCIARTSGVWDGSALVTFSNQSIDDDRARSLEFRLDQEKQLIAHAIARPAFGWGGWGRNRVTNDEGHDTSVTDGMWIIFLGCYGVVGLASYGLMTLGPVVRYALSVPAGEWANPQYAVTTGVAVAIALWCVDSLPNAAPFPLLVVMVGGLTRTTVTPKA